jgi:hypothetical protein
VERAHAHPGSHHTEKTTPLLFHSLGRKTVFFRFYRNLLAIQSIKLVGPGINEIEGLTPRTTNLASGRSQNPTFLGTEVTK